MKHNRPMTIRTSLIVGMTLWINSATFYSSAQDRLLPLQGSPANGTIVEITPEKVVIEVRGNKQEYKVADIRKITFDDEPSGLDRARELMLQDQYDQAYDELKKVNAANIAKPFAKQDYDFYRAYCESKLALAGTGDKNAAKASLLQIATKNSKTFHWYTLAETLGELALALGKPDEAANYFSALTKASAVETKARGVYWLAEVDLRKAKHAEAKKRFDQLAGATASTPEMTRLKNYAEVGLAVCMARSGQPQDALVQLQAMVQKYDSTDQALFAKIFNAQGFCHAEAGQVTRAIIAYLHTDLLFFSDPESHAEALYHLTVLWPKANHPQRAQEARQRLTSQYPSSSWANKK